MAFDDSKKFADKLRIKNQHFFQQGDPKAQRDVCWSPWCGNWVENMRDDHRCHQPECDRRLWEEAVKRGYAIRDPESGTYIGMVEPLLEKKIFEVPAEYQPVASEHMCIECMDQIARPKDVLCSKCRAAGKAKEYGERRLQAIGRKRGRLTHRMDLRGFKKKVK